MCRGNPHAGNERGFARGGGLSEPQSSGHMKSNGECPSLLYTILGAINAWGGYCDPALPVTGPGRRFGKRVSTGMKDRPVFRFKRRDDTRARRRGGGPKTPICASTEPHSSNTSKFKDITGGRFTLELKSFRTVRKQIEKQVYLHGLRNTVIPASIHAAQQFRWSRSFLHVVLAASGATSNFQAAVVCGTAGADELGGAARLGDFCQEIGSSWIRKRNKNKKLGEKSSNGDESGFARDGGPCRDASSFTSIRAEVIWGVATVNKIERKPRDREIQLRRKKGPTLRTSAGFQRVQYSRKRLKLARAACTSPKASPPSIPAKKDSPSTIRRGD
ncbi:hypothetical protein B0H11DRAFT_2330957 [Mycena galericulata]|nr:hypothetical protein B0H11DRAFT_2330957 [Mycena galericulata]